MRRETCGARQNHDQNSFLPGSWLFALCVSAQAQQPKIPRIGYLSNSDQATDSARSETICLALRELGFIEGQNIAIEYRYAEGKQDRAPELAAELVRLKVDIIVVAGGACAEVGYSTLGRRNSRNLDEGKAHG